MKKRAFLLLTMMILFINLVSAAYGCSNGTLEEEINKIDVGEIENTNGIGVGIIEGERDGLSVDILIDAKSLLLTNETSSIEVKLLSGNYDVELINLTEDSAAIKIEGDTEGIKKGETKKIDDLQVHLTDASGTYPGEDANVRLLVGIDNIFLHYNDLTKIKTINGTEYLFEFFSSSSTNAIITVKKCEGGDLIEIAETEDNNDAEINQTTNQTQNETDTNITDGGDIINDTLNDTEDITTNNTQNLEPDSTSTISESILKIIIPYGIILFIGVLIVIVIIYIKNKIKEKKVVEDDLKNYES